MTAFIGANVSATYTADELKQGVNFALGDKFVGHDGKEYVFVQYAGATTAGDVVIFSGSYVATVATSSNDSAGARVGVAAATAAASSYGWAQVYGAATARASAAVTSGANLMATTTGQVATAAASNFAILGMTATATIGSAGALAVMLTNPVFGDRVL